MGQVDFDALRSELCQLVIDERPAGYLEQSLRYILGQRPHARRKPTCKNDDRVQRHTH